jgi:ABC-type nitrate/sulfonate/bicarbonate transport system substrate-binding protein
MAFSGSAGALLAGVCAAAMAVMAAPPARAQSPALTKVTLITFAGATNLPVWIALEKGFFAKEGLDVTHEVTRGSAAVMNGLMSGKYQFGSAAFDNTVAYAEGTSDKKIENFDIKAIMGVHGGMNKIVTTPDIKSLKDIKGKAVASDAANSGYGLLMYRVIEKETGLKANKDYQVLAVGSGPNRIAAMKEGKAVAAAVSAPQDIEAKKAGFTIVGDATASIGAYQGSAYIVKQSWAKAHEKDVSAFIRGIVAGSDFVFAHKAESIAVMKTRIKNLSDEELASVYDDLVGAHGSKGGLNPGSKVNIEGVKTVLSLRNELGVDGKQLTDPYKYVDLSYYEKALPGR